MWQSATPHSTIDRVSHVDGSSNRGSTVKKSKKPATRSVVASLQISAALLAVLAGLAGWRGLQQ